MPTFDVVSEVDLQEVENAINQAKKEVATRYDFKDTKTTIEWNKKESKVVIESSSELKVKAVGEVLREKLVKRSVSLKALDEGKIEVAGGSRARRATTFKKGIDADRAREIVKLVKDLKLKVQTQIQGDELRITGKNRDDLQSAIQAIRAKDLPLPLQFTNFRE